MGKIDQFSNGESGASIRTKVNKALQSVAFTEFEAGVVIDDDTMATASATTLATSESIKAYVDAKATQPNIVSIAVGDSPYTVTGSEDIISVDASGGDVTINFPTATTFLSFPYIHQIDTSANNTIIDPNGAETIDGSATLTLATKEAIRVYSDGTNLQYV